MCSVDEVEDVELCVSVRLSSVVGVPSGVLVLVYPELGVGGSGVFWIWEVHGVGFLLSLVDMDGSRNPTRCKLGGVLCVSGLM